MSTLAQRITRAANEAHLTLLDLAEKTQLSRSSVQRYASNSTRGVPADKLSKIASALSVPNDYLLGARAFTHWDDIDADRKGFLSCVEAIMGERKFHSIAYCLYDVDLNTPEQIPLRDLTSFIGDVVQSAELRDGVWHIQLKSNLNKSDTSNPTTLTDSQIRAAFFNGADPTLTEDEQDALWNEAKEYINFKIQQRKWKELK